MAHFELEQSAERPARIKVIGVGGAGGNAVNNMIDDGLEGLVEFIVCNTDLQALARNRAEVRVQLGEGVTRGLGAGGDPDIGRKSALEDMPRIGEFIQGADMIFIACGLGGGTGTGAAPVIAQVAREIGALTVAVSTMPFNFEGKRRRRRALEGLDALAQDVDTLIKIPNQKLLEVVDQNMTVTEAFRMADKVLLDAVRGITELIQIPGEINVDFADVRSIMSNAGPALMGTGWGDGENRAVCAAQQAISSPLLEDVGVDGAMGILMNITGGPDLKLMEVSQAAELIEDAAHEDVNLIYGQVFDPDMTDQVKVTVIATGFDHAEAQAEVPQVMEQRRQRPTQQPAQHPHHQYRPTERPLARALNRRPEAEPAPAKQMVHARPEPHHAVFNEAEIDIPTFIRKQTE
jgi:cell division protein FtsZ